MKIVDKIFTRGVRTSKRLSRHRLYETITDICRDKELGNILFVGAGGELEALCRTFKSDSFVTIDIDASRGPDHVMDLTELKFDNNSFDTIFVLEVLEHVCEPAKAIDEMNRVLKSGGSVCVSTPFIFPIHEAPHDYFRYTKYGLDYLFRKWEKKAFVERTGYYWTILILLSRLAKVDKKKRKIVNIIPMFLALPFLPIIRAIDKNLPMTITTGYVARYQKVER